MSGDDYALLPRSGPVVRLNDGVKAGQRSLYQQQVLDEDTYTEALSHIITRDFFPNLPHIHATNSYLTALTNNDPELLSSSIRRLAALAREKEERQGDSSRGGDEARQEELDNLGTPYISLPGRRTSKAPLRTPVGARGWDTPVMRAGKGSTKRPSAIGVDEDGYDELEGDLQDDPGPSQRPKRRKQPNTTKRLRDDLPLDAFQHAYTSEDNASFARIVDDENRQRKQDRWSWAWEAEKKAEVRRIKAEEKRKSILDAATNGKWVVNAEGKRLVGGLDEGGLDRPVGEAWKDTKLITAAKEIGRMVDLDYKPSKNSSLALVPLPNMSNTPRETLVSEQVISDDHPLNHALKAAGLPPTVLVSTEDSAVIPSREVSSGSGDGRGRGDVERSERDKIEHATASEEAPRTISLGGSGADQWTYKTINNLMFFPDANVAPYPKPQAATISAAKDASRQEPKAIKHANTRLPDEDELELTSGSRSGSQRGSSPARSWVEAAVKGTPYRPGGGEANVPKVNNYSLLPNDPSPSPTDLPSLLTWGTLLATPRALDGGDDPLDLSTPSFRMPESKRRDEIGRKLADKASRSMNERAKGFTPRPGSSALRDLADKTQRSVRGDKASISGGMLPPSATPRRQANSLTPAGKRLLQRSMGLGRMGSNKSTSARNRSAAMEKGSGWASESDKRGSGGRDVGGMSLTPSPAGRRK